MFLLCFVVLLLSSVIICSVILGCGGFCCVDEFGGGIEFEGVEVVVVVVGVV